MGNKKRYGYNIDGGEIEFVSQHPLDHGREYVRVVRKACVRRWRKASGETRIALQSSLDRLNAAIQDWPRLGILPGGRVIFHERGLIRDQESGYLSERGLPEHQ